MVKKWNVMIPKLSGDKPRKAYIYLPDSYEKEPEKRYPVMYMFDGHNVFFDEDATFGKSWNMNKFMQETGKELIIVGIALTFDDGPSGLHTRALLAGLAVRQVKATFFLCGYRAEQYPELTEKIWQEGHEIGIHGYSHQNMVPMSRREIAGEIDRTRALLPEKCPIRLLRPPGGCCSDAVMQVARARGLAVLGWSVDPRDWATSDVIAIDTAVVEQVKDGDVVLLHDMTDSSVDAALAIIDHLQAQGFTFVTVSELAFLRRETIKPGVLYECFPPE